MKRLLSLAMICLYMIPINSMHQPRARCLVREIVPPQIARPNPQHNPADDIPVREILLDRDSDEIVSFTNLFEELNGFYINANNTLRAYSETIAEPYKTRINTLCNRINAHNEEANRTLARLQHEQFSINALNEFGTVFEHTLEEIRDECILLEQEMHIEANNDHPILMYKLKSGRMKRYTSYERKRLDGCFTLRDITRRNEERFNINSFVRVAERLPSEDERSLLDAYKPFSHDIIRHIRCIRFGAHNDRSNIFLGAPHTRKSQLAQAIAQMVGRPCFILDIPSFLDECNAVNIKMVGALDQINKMNIPCIVVLDNIDTLSRSGRQEWRHGIIRAVLPSLIDRYSTGRMCLIETAHHFESLSPRLLDRSQLHRLVLPNPNNRTHQWLKKIGSFFTLITKYSQHRPEHRASLYRFLKYVGTLGSSVAGSIVTIKIGKKYKNVAQRALEVAKRRWPYTLAGTAIVGTASAIGIKKYAWPRFEQWRKRA